MIKASREVCILAFVIFLVSCKKTPTPVSAHEEYVGPASFNAPQGDTNLRVDANLVEGNGTKILIKLTNMSGKAIKGITIAVQEPHVDESGKYRGWWTLIDQISTRIEHKVILPGKVVELNWVPSKEELSQLKGEKSIRLSVTTMVNANYGGLSFYSKPIALTGK